ncbi:MAG TPA: M56 family metallopeptidase [Vicinamibacterales bacterium]|nr:M56 family metallopeptidase [Vicinamibacterales bacterium]
MDSIVFANVAAHSAQVALIIGVASLLPWLFRIDAPSFRYVYWRALLALCLLLPLLQGWQAAPGVASTFSTISGATGIDPSVDSLSAGPFAPASWLFLAAAVLAGGVVVRAAWVVISLLHLRRLRSAGRTAPLGGEADDLQRTLGTRAAIRFVAGLRQPVTFGIRWPVVLLPDTILEHPEQLQRVVLCHELLHVQRNDWAWAFAEELLRVVFWFHPAVWWAVSRVQLAREEVVDEQVVKITGSRRRYIEALMTFAEATPVASAAAFSRRRHLFRRILLISKQTVVSSRRQLLSGVAMAVFLLAGSRYAVDAFPLLRAPAATHSQTTQPRPDQDAAVASGSAAGRFTNAGAPPPPPPPPPPPGPRDASSRTTVPPRTLDTPRIRLEGVNDDRDVSPAVEASRDAGVVPEAVPSNPDQQTSFSATGALSDTANATPIRVGGSIRQPQKIRDVKPVYPPIAQAAKVSGVVILELVVGVDGRVMDARIIRSVPLLDEAALSAVRQWEFVPTLLNGAPTAIVMSVTVNFTLG